MTAIKITRHLLVLSLFVVTLTVATPAFAFPVSSGAGTFTEYAIRTVKVPAHDKPRHRCLCDGWHLSQKRDDDRAVETSYTPPYAQLMSHGLSSLNPVGHVTASEEAPALPETSSDAVTCPGLKTGDDPGYPEL